MVRITTDECCDSGALFTHVLANLSGMTVMHFRGTTCMEDAARLPWTGARKIKFTVWGGKWVSDLALVVEISVRVVPAGVAYTNERKML
jgi:hypothetical protein